MDLHQFSEHQHPKMTDHIDQFINRACLENSAPHSTPLLRGQFWMIPHQHHTRKIGKRFKKGRVPDTKELKKNQQETLALLN